MFSGKVLIWWILMLLCVLRSCDASTVELSVFPNEAVDFGNASATVTFKVGYNITESGKVFGIIISMGSAVVVDCRPARAGFLSTIGLALSVMAVAPNNCKSLKGAVAVSISSGMLEFKVTFSNITVEPGWSAGLLDFNSATIVNSSTLHITVGDLRKVANVTVAWTGDVPILVFQCSIGKVQPAVDLVVTVPGFLANETALTPDTVKLEIAHDPALDGINFTCAVDVVYPVVKSLSDSFPIEYAPVFQSRSVSVLCPDDTCQVTLNCSSQGIRAYPAATLTWLHGNSTDDAVALVVTGPGDYSCQANNNLGNDTVTFKVEKEPRTTTPNIGSSTVTTEPTTSTTHKVCDGKECQNDGILDLETCKCICEYPYYGHFCQDDLRPIVAVVVVLGVYIVYIVYIVVSVVAAFTCFPKAGERFLGLGVGGKVCAVAGGIVVMYWKHPSHGCCCQRPSTKDRKVVGSDDPPIPLEGTGYEVPLCPTPPKQSSTTKKCAGGTGQSDNVQISMSAELNNLRFKTSSQTMDDTITAEDYMTPVSSQKKMKLIQSQYIEIGARHEEAPNSYDTLKFARDNTTDGPAIYDEVNISDDLLDQGVTKTYENVYL